MATLAECPTCGHPMLGSVCFECSERIIAERDSAAAILGGYKALDEFTLERFIAKTDIQKTALESAKSFNPTRDNLYFVGTVGTGKSHLSVAIMRQFLGHIKVCLLRQSILSRKVRSADDAEAEGRIIQEYASMGVLAIDDLGSAKDTEFMSSIIYELIDWRYMNVPGGLIVTSNRTLDQLAEKLGDDRVPSRLAQMCKVINLSGDDHRLPPRINNFVAATGRNQEPGG